MTSSSLDENRHQFYLQPAVSTGCLVTTPERCSQTGEEVKRSLSQKSKTLQSHQSKLSIMPHSDSGFSPSRNKLKNFLRRADSQKHK